MASGVAGGKNLESRWKKIADLKTRAKVLTFLQQNNITDMAQLANKVTQSYEQAYDVSGKIKAIERWLGTLADHLAQYDNYRQHKAVYEKHKQLDPKKCDAFYSGHGEEIQAYENAKRYLEAVMNGKKTLPIHAWKSELAKLTAEKYGLFDEYYRLKDDTRSVEILRKSAEAIMREDVQERSHTQAQEVNSLARKKPGPHPEEPLDIQIKTRADKETMEKIEFCLSKPTSRARRFCGAVSTACMRAYKKNDGSGAMS